jgi:hypothetical protein
MVATSSSWCPVHGVWHVHLNPCFCMWIGGARLGDSLCWEVLLRPRSSVSELQFCWARCICRFLFHWKQSAAASTPSELGSGCFKPCLADCYLLWLMCQIGKSIHLPGNIYIPYLPGNPYIYGAGNVYISHGESVHLPVVVITLMQAVSAALTPCRTIWSRFWAFFTRISSEDLLPGVNALTLKK